MKRTSDILTTTSQSRQMTHDKCSVHTGMGAKMRAMLSGVCGVFQSFFKGTWDRLRLQAKRRKIYMYSLPHQTIQISRIRALSAKQVQTKSENNNPGEPIKSERGSQNNKAKSAENERISQLNHSFNMKYKIIKVTEVTQETLGEGRKRSHRRVICTTPDNQSFAFHLWGAMALDFEGKVGDIIRAEYRSRVHVSRSGLYHTNLSLVEYDVIHRKAEPDDYQFISNTSATQPNCEIGVRGVDYPDFDDATIDYLTSNSTQCGQNSNSETVYNNNKEINYEGQCQV